jgi:hypothetical protein
MNIIIDECDDDEITVRRDVSTLLAHERIYHEALFHLAAQETAPDSQLPSTQR